MRIVIVHLQLIVAPFRKKRAERKGPTQKQKPKGRHQRTPPRYSRLYGRLPTAAIFIAAVVLIISAFFVLPTLSSPEKKTQKFVPPPVYLIDEWNEHLRSGARNPGDLLSARMRCAGRSRRPICCTCLTLMTALDTFAHGKSERMDSITISTTDENGNDVEIPFRYSKDRIHDLLKDPCPTALKYTLPAQ